MLEKLLALHQETVRGTPLKTRRYLYEAISWKEHALCLTGARGVGKTTLLLQHYHEHYASVEKCLYLSGDNLNVISHGLAELAGEYFKTGGEALIIDEVHKYPGWSQEIKNIIDTYKDKKIMISGSSSLAIRKGAYDLSRRLATYELKGMSFREYLSFSYGQEWEPIPWADLLDKHLSWSSKLMAAGPVLKYFKEYLNYGYYPYFLEGKETYQKKLATVIEKTIFEDIAVIFNVSQAKLPTLKRMIWLVASSEPFSPNIERMAKELSLSKEYVYLFIDYLEKVHLIQSLRAKQSGFRLIRKPEKLFLDNPNLIKAILGEINLFSNEGSIRETFFLNQVSVALPVYSSLHGDFNVQGKWEVEVGGKNKSATQIAGAKHGLVALDNIEIGTGNRIPLYLFGFLY